MIHNDTPHRIFKISELTRLIASQLVLINRKDAVNLACACRYLEEPVLSTLWETQWSLCTLLKVLPEENRGSECLERGKYMVKYMLRIAGDPPPEAWNRVQRYASWMHQVRVDERFTVVEDTFHKLRVSSPSGGWFPALQDLSWCITKSNLPYADLFFSPHLKKILIYTPWSWASHEVPRDILAAVVSTISTLPTSVLQSLSIDIKCVMPSAYFKDAVSSVVLRCGPLLTEFTSMVPLSDAAVNHLIQLPHLCTWHIEDPPPKYSTSSLPLVFPPLTDFTLGEGAACGWLSLFERLEEGASPTQGVTLSRVKNSLKSLDVRGLFGLVIDVSFTSKIQTFRNLASLCVGVHCPGRNGEGQCAFRLTNDDVFDLATALPQLESLLLGDPCRKNTCATTVACLLLVSVYCVKLRELKIHFNTTRIVDDLKNITEDPQYQELCLLPRCTLSLLYIDRMPLALDKPVFEAVANGMIDIFPSLVCCAGLGRGWGEVTEIISELREM